jgi:hypothetical protein
MTKVFCGQLHVNITAFGMIEFQPQVKCLSTMKSSKWDRYFAELVVLGELIVVKQVQLQTLLRLRELLDTIEEERLVPDRRNRFVDYRTLDLSGTDLYHYIRITVK